MSNEEQHDTGGELAADIEAAYPPRPLDEVELLAIIRQLVRVKGGGDVQRAFGRPQMGSEGGFDLTGQRWDRHGGGAAEQAQAPDTVTCSGGVRLPSLGGGNRG